MLSKEEILASVQQGLARPDWQVLHPKTSYLVKQALTWAVLAVLVIGFGVYFVSQYSFVFVPFFSGGTLDPSTFQTWRYIDEAFLAAATIIFVWLTLKTLLDLNTIQQQVLVLTPQSFLLKQRRTEQFVAYAGVSSISPRAGRYGDVTLNVKPAGNNALYRVQLDGRYGNPKALASQIVTTQRQYATGPRPGMPQPQ